MSRAVIDGWAASGHLHPHPPPACRTARSDSHPKPTHEWMRDSDSPNESSPTETPSANWTARTVSEHDSTSSPCARCQPRRHQRQNTFGGVASTQTSRPAERVWPCLGRKTEPSIWPVTKTSNRSGGAAAAGGFDFQAALGTIAYIHTLRGSAIPWTDDWTASPPTAVSFETGGPGDDISLTCVDGSKVEVQAKKGLKASKRFWSALESLCDGVASERCDYGILAVCPQSSQPVRRHYAMALRRLAGQRGDRPSDQQTKLAAFLAKKGYDVVKVCTRIRIKTISAVIDDTDAITAARSELGHICKELHQVGSAWNALYRDAMSAISIRGRRTITSLVSVLRSSEVNLSRPLNDSPAAISASILESTNHRTEHFEILGLRVPLPTDRAWLPLKALVQDGPFETESSVEEALAAYHAVADKPDRRRDGEIDARTIGTFRQLCVVIGGPGSGKSLLLKVLAREFAKDSFVSLRVRMRDLAKRIERDGCTVEEGIIALGLDGSGISPEQFRTASLSQLVILCDGLDECGNHQSVLAAGLRSIAAAHPSYRIVVTTRPIGYSTSRLRDWRHYELAPLVAEDVPRHLEILCRAAPEGVEDEDQLHDRVQSYLGAGDSARTLARTPLLLALGASLFLKWQHPCETKMELYDRIFKMIDNVPSLRTETPAHPTKAVRRRVLNELAWQVLVSPLLGSENIETRCAQRLQAETRTSYLQALSDVQQSIGYWEAVGLLERLQHAGFELITFVHKTCGEFAAARHLAAMEPDKARSLIQDELANPGSEEILDFATQTPLASTLAEMLTAEFEAADANLDILNRLLRILARPETSLSTAQRKSFLERLFALVQSEDRQKAYRAGLCLTRNDLSRLPEAAGMACRLLKAKAEWSRLVGWTVLCRRFPEYLQPDALEDAFHHFLVRSRHDDFFVLKDAFFGRYPDREVFEEFLIGALRLLLANKDVHYQDRLITAVSDAHTPDTDFLSRIDALLKEMGRRDAMRQIPRWDRRLASTAWASIDFGALDKASRRFVSALVDVISAAFRRRASAPPPVTGPKSLSAFLRMSGLLYAHFSDIDALPSDGAQLSELHSILRAAAAVFGLSPERLAAEAQFAIEAIEVLVAAGAAFSGFEIFPEVDAPEIHWERAADFRIDNESLERLVHHPSGYISRLAALMLNARLDECQRMSVCERILSNGKGAALFWGAALATAQSDQRGRDLVLRRLEGHPIGGLHHLFDVLLEDKLMLVPAHARVLETGLFDLGVKTAVSAAQWCQGVAKTSDIWVVSLLKRAMDYWLEHEGPCPVGVGTVPDSPREALLRTLCAITDFDFDQLVALTEDKRRDVSNAAVDYVTAYAIRSPDRRRSLVDMICAQRFPVRRCEMLLNANVPYTTAELLRMAQMRNDPDAMVRAFVVRRVFAHPRMDPGKAASAVKRMTRDPNGNVRDAAYRFLDSTTGTA